MGASSVAGFTLETLGRLRTDLARRDSPVTGTLLLAIGLSYLVQSAVASDAGVSRVEATAALFYYQPLVAWLFGAFLHRDLVHVGTNLVAVGFLGRVLEPQFGPRRFLGLLLAAGVVSGLGAYLFTVPFADGWVAAYGASGLAYALAGVALTLPLRARGRPEHAAVDAVFAELSVGEGLAVVVGLSALATVGLDLATGPYWAVGWVNGAHLGGFALGVAVGLVRYAAPDSPAFAP